MSDPQPRAATTSSRRIVVTAAVVAFTMVFASGATVLASRLLLGSPATQTVALDVADAPAPTPTATPEIATTRLAVQGPRRVLDPQAGGALPPGGEAAVPLPTLPAGTTAVLLQLSLTEATGPGAVTLRSSTEQTPVLRLAGPGAQTSATVVAGLGADAQLWVRTEGGGRLQVDLVGVFEPAASSTYGRVVAVPPTPVVDLTPDQDGDRTTVDLAAVPALQGAGAVSAVLVRFAGDVGERGGYVSVGPSADLLDQTVSWSATAGADRIRPGFLVVPVRSGQLHVQYKAGSHLGADLVGYVTGASAPDGTAGLVVPVPVAAAAPVTVTAEGRVDVGVVPAGGTAGVLPGRVAAALVTVEATGEPGTPVSVGSPTSPDPGAADVAADPAGRRALSLSGIVDGSVAVATGARAVVVLTPRALVVGE